MAYQQEAIVNWDPIDKTVLANEQVDAEGKSWRSGAQVERKRLKQWFFRIRHYAQVCFQKKNLYQDLLDGLDKLDEWPELVKTLQRQWIQRSEGTIFYFKIVIIFYILTHENRMINVHYKYLQLVQILCME